MESDVVHSILVELMSLDKYYDCHFNFIKKHANDEDCSVRSICAAALFNFNEKEEAKDILLKLTKDPAEFVRTEAYDSLSAFKSVDVAAYLLSAITEETDSLARRYAIHAWVDIVHDISDCFDDDITFLKALEVKGMEDECILACCRGLYFFGESEYFEKTTAFLTHRDYHLRCSVLNMLLEFYYNDNSVKNQIEEAINTLLKTETSIAVISTAKKTLKQMYN